MTNIKIYTKLALLFLLSIGVATGVSAQKVTITGKLRPGSNNTVLHLVNHQKNIDIPVKLLSDQSFRVDVPVLSKGFYSLGDMGDIYLEPGFNLQIIPRSDKGYSFSGIGSTENNILINITENANKLLPVDEEGNLYFAMLNSSPDSLLLTLNAYKKVIAQYTANSNNKFFKRIESENAESYCHNLISTFTKNYGLDSVVLHKIELINTSTYLTDPKDRKKQRLFYMLTVIGNWLTDAQKKTLDSLSQLNFNWNNEDLFYNSKQYQTELVDKITEINKKRKGPTDTADPNQYLVEMNLVNEEVSNSVIKNYLKGVFGLKLIRFSKNEKQIDSVYHSLMGLTLALSDKEKIEGQYNNYKLLKSSPESVGFAYTDVNGKEVSLKSLRGKYVYIDIWATWCVPCLMEVPSLKIIEEEYKNRNIQFVSLSVDKQADKKKWQDMVRNQEMTGIQLITDKDFNSNFIETFQVTSIPRFILIDPQGKIVSADAFRPSQPELKKQLDELLKPFSITN